ncbi:hypothetical protein BGZ47_003573 [Haplosporangium gracile]|nr:hypothetical protein BGZ47_003573 [Haplosporangium gracile]
MAVTVPAEPTAASAATSSALTIPTNTPTAATVVSRSIKTGRHNRGERMTFELDDVLREYTPDQFKTCKAYDVGGVNILNKKPVDSKTALDKIKRRRETHNRVERRRRDYELTALLPKEDDNDISKSHRVNILRTAIAHIQNLTRQNENLQQQVNAFKAGRPMPPPAIITTLAPMMDYDDSETAYRLETTVRTTEPVIWRSTNVILKGNDDGIDNSFYVGYTHDCGTLRADIDSRIRHYRDHNHSHHHRNRSNSGGGGGYPQSPSYYGHDSASATSPTSTYSDYSSSTGPWSSSSGGPYSAGLGGIGGGGGGGPQSSTSSSFGTSPRSPHFSNYGPPSPYSPYGPSSAHAQMSPSPGLAPWNAIPSSSPSTVPHPSGGSMQDHPPSPRP